MKLREYQESGINAIRKHLSEKKKRLLVVAPTGAGKSLIFTYIATSAIERGKSVMIVADRWELLKQAQAHLRKHRINPTLITPKWKGQISNCYVASIQTLNRRQMPDVDIIILDEAHINAYSRVLDNEAYHDTIFLGFTATPESTRKFDLSAIYEEMVEVTKIGSLIDSGYLLPAKYYAAWEDFGKIKMRGQEYDEVDLFNKFNKRSMYDGMIEAYKTHTPNTKAICFCINVDHGEHVLSEFTKAGIKAVFVHGETEKQIRDHAFDQYENGDTMVLINVGIATKGYDNPATETIILNRKTKSLPLYLQMIGRGSRTFGQLKYFNIIDMGSNLIEHGWYDDDRVWALTPQKKTSGKKGLAPIKICPNSECGCIVPAVAATCKYCGFIFPKKEEKLLEASEIVEIQKEDLKTIPPELIGKPYHKMTIAELETVRSVKKYKLGWIVRILAERGDSALEEYRQLKGFKHGWDKFLTKTKQA